MRRRVHPVWGLDALLVGVAVVAGALLAGVTEPFVAAPGVPWLAVAVAFVAAERCVVHLPIGRSAHTFSLGDAPFVLGLLFVGPRLLLAATVAGLTILLLSERELPTVKRVFNVAQFAIAASVAIVLFRALAPAGALATDPVVWLSALVAMQCAGVLGAVLIAAAIAVTDGRVSRATVTEMVVMDGAVTLANTTLGLVAGVIVAAQPWALVLLAVPGATVFLAYRSYIVQRSRAEALDLLHQTTRTLARSTEVASSLESLLGQCLRAFRADLAEVVLFTDDGPLRTTVTIGGRESAMEPLTAPHALALGALVTRGEGATALAGGELPPHLVESGMVAAAMTTLRTDGRPLGVIAVARRRGTHAAFAAEELLTLDALAAHTSVALQNDHREQAVASLTALKVDLEHRAYHDDLTGLPNRRRFLEELSARAMLDPGTLAVLYIDVDDFKVVNDELGHAAGDEVLVSTARRLRGCVRPADVVARLAGDEFVILLEASGDPPPYALAIADRIIAAFEHPVEVGGHMVDLTVSIGIATPGPVADTHDLVRLADGAMYSAKRGGKGRFRMAEREPAAA